MAKFKVFEHNQAFLARLGIYSYSITEPTNDCFKSIPAYYILFVGVSCLITSSAVYVYQNYYEFGDALDTCYIVISGFISGGMFLNVGLNMIKAKALHLKLQELVDNASDREVYDTYWKYEQKCRNYTRYMRNYVICHQQLFVAAMTYSIYCICVGNFDTSTWSLPFYMVVPFDTSSIWGWYCLWFVQFNTALSYTLPMTSTTLYFVCCCFYIFAICDHFELIMHSIDEIVKQNKITRNPLEYQQKRSEIKERLKNAIKIHNKIDEVFRMAADINSGTIFALLPANVIYLALAMYNMEHSPFDVVSFTFNLIAMICSLIWPYLICKYATYATNRLSAVGDIAYGSMWFYYPPELQKYVALSIAHSGVPTYFTGFGLIGCTIEIFGKLLKSSCSYYVLFRQLSSR